MKTIYIAGPMRGYPLFNFPAFDAAEADLKARGYKVISPAAMDREMGFDPATSEATAEYVEQAIRRDLEALETVDEVCLLPGWDDSHGATKEYHRAKELGLTIWNYVPQDAQTKFSTGSVRSKDADNVAYHLISPVGLRRLAETYREGSQKYGDYNWEKGQPVGEVLNHTIRHIYKYLEGDRSEDHMAHAAWGLMAVMHFEEKNPEMLEGLRSTSDSVAM